MSYPQKEKNIFEKPPAVVVGLYLNGLDIVRALSKNNIEVHALEKDPNKPAVKTRLAQVHFTEDIEGPGLIQALLDLRKNFKADRKPVLFVTNDNIILRIADNWPVLDGLYSLSWAHCRDTIRDLVIKANLHNYCERANILYPRSYIINSADDIPRIDSLLSRPFIAKPVRPLSKFKVKLLNSPSELRKLIDDYSSELPFLVQDHIPGEVKQQVFGIFYLRNGDMLAHFGVRKLATVSMGLGSATVAEPYEDEAVREEALRFFKGLNLSGPASLELKRDKDGKLWAIEPTVGRPEYWNGFCIANGINFPYIEYCHQAGMEIPRYERTKRSVVWLDIERDPLCFFWFLRNEKLAIFKGGRRIVFSYFDKRDIRPFIEVMSTLIKNGIVSIGKRLAKIMS